MNNPSIQPRTKPTLQRMGLYVLILLALGMISLVTFVIVTDEPIMTADEAFPEPVIVDPEKRPDFVFPEAVRTTDLSLNRFVDRFARVCVQGKYNDFRLMLSTKRPPILPPRFESNFNALKQVRIVAIDSVPDLPASVGPVYVMKAEYDLQDYAVRQGEHTKQVHVAITQEEGVWRLGPIPHEAMQRLIAFQNAQSTSAPADSSPTSAPATADADSTAASRAIANKPARL
jgi:hypothetical protein